ncbi:MAG: ABC transporter permease [Geminicoccaceae bacterium]|nr:ABC transporter permease [Geminicoccaceae bacterium]
MASTGGEARAPALDLPEDGTTFGTFWDINYVGLWTLYVKEVRRFMKVVTQTVLAPVATTLIFLAVFSLALGGASRTVGNLPYLTFLAPGLVMMSVIQNAFSNTSSSIIIAKVQGNIVDYLMPPLSAGELLFGVTMGGVTRGFLVATVVWLTMLPFADVVPHHLWAVLYYVLAASLVLSLLGFLAALWAEKFDQMAAVTNFIITPLSFLSGTFYSIQALPEAFHAVALANPFFYMIDGLRYGLTGHADGSVAVGALYLLVVSAALWGLALALLRRGYRLKA